MSDKLAKLAGQVVKEFYSTAPRYRTGERLEKLVLEALRHAVAEGTLLLLDCGFTWWEAIARVRDESFPPVVVSDDEFFFFNTLSSFAGHHSRGINGLDIVPVIELSDKGRVRIRQHEVPVSVRDFLAERRQLAVVFVAKPAAVVAAERRVVRRVEVVEIFLHSGNLKERFLLHLGVLERLRCRSQVHFIQNRGFFV